MAADLEVAVQARLAEVVATWRTDRLVERSAAQLAHELPQSPLLL